ncbi:MAG TPA: hypothetical protein VKD19_13595 [Pseudolabrys sp.]|nr:hypothetical protein [Pseudolabrys sp.]
MQLRHKIDPATAPDDRYFVPRKQPTHAPLAVAASVVQSIGNDRKGQQRRRAITHGRLTFGPEKIGYHKPSSSYVARRCMQ